MLLGGILSVLSAWQRQCLEASGLTGGRWVLDWALHVPSLQARAKARAEYIFSLLLGCMIA